MRDWDSGGNSYYRPDSSIENTCLFTSRMLNAIYEDGRMVEAACWAHARRKFHELHAVWPSATTDETLHRIGKLYAIEAEIPGKAHGERQRVRQARTRPLLTRIEIWLREKLRSLSRKSDTAGAIQ